MRLGILALTLIVSQFAKAGERPLPSDGNIVNVRKDFGAKGDGRTDDTEAILAAIRSVIANRKAGTIRSSSISRKAPIL